MPGPIGKDPTTRQRRNRSSTSKQLYVVEDKEAIEIPDLPDIEAPGWHPMTEEFWVEIWCSPMHTEYTDSDYYVILKVCTFWNLMEWALEGGRVSMGLELMKEIRLWLPKLGLSPDDRRRLQWTINQGDAAQQRIDQRNRDAEARAGAGNPAEDGPDPRHGLRSVN